MKHVDRRSLLKRALVLATGVVISPVGILEAVGGTDYDDATVRARKGKRVENKNIVSKVVNIKTGYTTLPRGAGNESGVGVSANNLDSLLKTVGNDGFETIYFGNNKKVGAVDSYENKGFSPLVVPSELVFGSKESGDLKTVQLDTKKTQLGFAIYRDNSLNGNWTLPTFADASSFSNKPSGAVLATKTDGKAKYYLFDEDGELVKADTITRTPLFAPDGLNPNFSIGKEAGVSEISFARPEGVTTGYTYTPQDGWSAKVSYTHVGDFGKSEEKKEIVNFGSLSEKVKNGGEPLSQSEAAFLKDASRFAVLKKYEFKYVGLARKSVTALNSENVASYARGSDGKIIPGSELYNTQILDPNTEQLFRLNLGIPGVLVAPGSTFRDVNSTFDDRFIHGVIGRVVGIIPSRPDEEGLGYVVVSVSSDMYNPNFWVGCTLISDVVGAHLSKKNNDTTVYEIFNNGAVEYVKSLVEKGVLVTNRSPKYGERLERMYSPHLSTCLGNECKPTREKKIKL